MLSHRKTVSFLYSFDFASPNGIVLICFQGFRSSAVLSSSWWWKLPPIADHSRREKTNMFTKAFAGLGLAFLLASAPAHADSCYQSTQVYGDGNQVINNCYPAHPAPVYAPPPPPVYYPVYRPMPGPMPFFAGGGFRHR
jgi:hypothetical protein